MCTVVQKNKNQIFHVTLQPVISPISDFIKTRIYVYALKPTACDSQIDKIYITIKFNLFLKSFTMFYHTSLARVNCKTE